eukprot:Sdes_comp19058_c0_seq1m9650
MNLCMEICSIFCCPPIPSRIASKLAFLPPACSYKLIAKNSDIHLAIRQVSATSETSSSQSINSESSENFVLFKPPAFLSLQGITLRTRKNNTIAAYHITHKGSDSSSQESLTLLYSHGNAVDIGQMVTSLCYLSKILNINIFTYDYSGYGISTGKPSESNCYADIEAAWSYLVDTFGLSSQNIIPYGQSIGSGSAVYIALKHKNLVKALILHSPLSSGNHHVHVHHVIFFPF